MCKYVIIDLEMCNVPRNRRTEGYPWRSEIIQIGAVLIDGNYEIVDSFSTYIHPEFGQIDPFIQRLTGINIRMTHKAPKIQEALKNFACWLPEKDVKMVSWSENDKIQLRREMKAKAIEIGKIEQLFEDWIDCQKIYGEKIGVNRLFRLSEALNSVYIDTVGRQHDGLSDAYNTALLFTKMEKEVNLQFNDTYIYAITEAKNPLKFSLGEIFANMNMEAVFYGM